MKTSTLGHLFGALILFSCSHSTGTRTTVTRATASSERPSSAAADDVELFNSFTPVEQAHKPSGLPVPRLEDAATESRPTTEGIESTVVSPQKHFKQALEEKSFEAAMKAALEWLDSCAPPITDNCRQKAFAAMEKAGSLAGKARKSHSQRITLWKDAVRCVRGAEKSKAKKPTPTCWRQARQTFQTEKDAMMIARMLLMDGQWASQHSSRHREAHKAWSSAEKFCPSPQCRNIREEALHYAANLLIQDKEWKKAAQATFQLLKSTISEVPPSRQKLGRTERVEKLCTRIDAGSGEGACRQFEKQYFSEPTFYDFSREARRGELSSIDILKVNTHFVPLLEACLREQALRLPVNSEEQYALRWVIGPDGRVQFFELLTSKGTTSHLETCLVNQFSWWRYPRYEGENRVIEQTFTIRSSTSGKNP